jgi:predicted nucleic acid-binding protein
MDFLLDTSALLAHFRNEEGAGRVQAIIEDPGAEIYISSLSVAEFARRLVSLGAGIDDARSAALEYAAVAAKVLPVDTVVSIRAFEIGSACETRLPLVDALIAASASVAGAVLVHKDPHFDVVPGGFVTCEGL